MQQASERRATQQRFQPLACELMRGRASGRLDNQDGLAGTGAAPRRAPGPRLTSPTAPPPAAPRSARRARPCRAPRAATRNSDPRVAASRPGRDYQRAIRPGGVRLTRFRRVLRWAPGERDRARRCASWPGTGAPDPRLVSGVLSALSCRYDRPITVFSAQTVRPSARNRPPGSVIVV